MAGGGGSVAPGLELLAGFALGGGPDEGALEAPGAELELCCAAIGKEKAKAKPATTIDLRRFIAIGLPGRIGLWGLYR